MKNTKFAPAERADQNIITNQFEFLQQTPDIQLLMDQIPFIFFIINDFRQIVFANQKAIDFIRLEIGQIIGSRLGELLQCINSTKEEGGCGTALECTYCGAVNAMINAHKRETSINEHASIITTDNQAYEFDLWVTPLIINNQKYKTIVVLDKTDEQRRVALERIFFHDILNTAMDLLFKSHYLIMTSDMSSGEIDNTLIYKRLHDTSVKLIDEIKSHQTMVSIEKNEHVPDRVKFNIMKLIYNLADSFKMIYTKNSIIINKNTERTEMETDPSLIRRILQNMLKNALEASKENDTITIEISGSAKENIKISVNNPSFMSKEIQLQIFKRSFSTKGNNRGFGTYGMKLLSNILGGEVYFESDKERGTTFNLSLPRIYIHNF